VCTPTRTRIGAVDGHSALGIASWIAAAAATASAGWLNTEKVESPSPLARTSVPPAAATSRPMMTSCRATACAIWSGSRSHSDTEPTMSVKTNERGYQPPLPVGTATFSQVHPTMDRRVPLGESAALIAARIRMRSDTDPTLTLSLRGSTPATDPRCRTHGIARRQAWALIRSRRTCIPERAWRPGLGSLSSSPRRQGHG
jgi:hypothetical protein